MAKQTLSDTAKEATMVKLKTSSLCFFFGAGSFVLYFRFSTPLYLPPANYIPLTLVPTRCPKVRICTAGSSTDCVTSKPNTFPIKALQDGHLLVSHSLGDGSCDSSCVDQTWDYNAVERAKQLVHNQCTSETDATLANHSLEFLYAASCNANGLHFLLTAEPTYPDDNDDDGCGWTSGGGGELDAYVDTPAAKTTTLKATTTEHPVVGNVKDLTDIVIKVATRIAVVESSNAAVEERSLQNEARVETLSESVETMQKNADGSAAAKLEALQVDFHEMRDTLTSMVLVLGETQGALKQAQETIATLVSAITKTGSPGSPGKPTGCGPGSDAAGCAPRLEGNGVDIDIIAANGAVNVATKTCGTIDLCAVKNIIEALKSGLLA